MGSPGSGRLAAAKPGAATAASITPASNQGLHVGIIGTSAAFRDHPVDVLGRVLDVACLAVNAIGRIDLKPRITRLLPDDLINAGRAVTLLGRVVEREIDRDRYLVVLERQMNGLVFLMVGVRNEHRGQPVEAQYAVGLGIDDWLDLVLAPQGRVVGMVLQCP